MPKIQRSCSEKRTVKTLDGSFLSVEHFSSREMTLPDDAPQSQINAESVNLLLQVKRECLIPFVLDKLITQEEFQRTMDMYESLLNVAEENR